MKRVLLFITGHLIFSQWFVQCLLQLAQPFQKAVAVPISVPPPLPTPPQNSLYVISPSSLELI